MRVGYVIRDIDEKMTLFAEWDDTKYTVIFKDADGSVLKEINGFYGEKLDPPAVKDGSFKNWGVDRLPATITESITYTATYSTRSAGCNATVTLGALPTLLAPPFALKRKKM